jgi:hypothetical protein
MKTPETLTQRNVGATILEQLGGANRLRAMLGVRAFWTRHDSLMFRFAAGRSLNHIEIKLNFMDLYDVEVWLSRGGDRVNVKTEQNVFCGNLLQVCERMTGLAFRL